MGINLTDSTTSTLTATNLSNNDGIAIDGMGNFYVSSWTLNKVTQYIKSGKYEEIPEKYRKSLLEGKWPPQRG